jgi:hypothetical protein
MSKHAPRLPAISFPTQLARRSISEPLAARRRHSIVALSVLAALIGAQLVFSPWTRSSTMHTFIPKADAFVTAGASEANFGTRPRLRTDGRPFETRSYVRFDVSTLTGSVRSAKLHLFANRTNDIGIAVRAVEDNHWTESTISYRNAPPMTRLLRHSTPTSDDHWVEIDVTDALRGNHATVRNGELTLGLTRSPFTLLGHDFRHAHHAQANFASRENRAHAPQLVVVSDGSPAVATTTSPSSPSTTTGPTPTTVTTPSTTVPRPPVVPPPAPRPGSSCHGPVIPVLGRTAQAYEQGSSPAGATFDLSGWYSDSVGQSANHAFMAGDRTAPTNLCILGGVVNGHIPLSSDWTATHSYGGFGYRTTSSGLAMVDGARVHNVEDGWKPREAAATRDVSATYPNVGIMAMRNVYMTGIRDDAIEDDEFMPGDIQDSLFDGVWCFLSEQNQTGGSPATIGPSEDGNIRITRDYVRLSVTNGGETGAGHWFKWQGRGSRNHTLIITDSVFAADSQPRLGWSSLSIPAGTVWRGSNFILWLGAPGGYVGPRPAGVTFLEGQAAKDKWNQVRNGWLIAHGYAPRPANDFDPMDDPVVAPVLR